MRAIIIWTCLIIHVLLFVSLAGGATPVGPGVFSADAITEGFEDLEAGPNFVINGPYARPGVNGPYMFPSGLVFSNPVPNPFSSDTVIADFSFDGGAAFGLGDNGHIELMSDVAFGTAYMGMNRLLTDPDPFIEFTPPSGTRRIGGYVTSNPGDLTLTLFNSHGDEIGSHSIPSVRLDDWSENFLGLESTESIARARFYGDVFVIDNVLFDVPEPSAAFSAAIGSLCFGLFRRRSHSGSTGIRRR